MGQPRRLLKSGLSSFPSFLDKSRAGQFSMAIKKSWFMSLLGGCDDHWRRITKVPEEKQIIEEEEGSRRRKKTN